MVHFSSDKTLNVLDLFSHAKFREFFCNEDISHFCQSGNKDTAADQDMSDEDLNQTPGAVQA